MKTPLSLLLVALLLLAGCSTVNSRIREKASFFKTLDAPTQARLRQSVVHVGDNQDMVYIAFGQPDRVRERTTAGGQDTIWIYGDYTEQYDGTAFVGMQRRAYFNRHDMAWHAYYLPVRADYYRGQYEEYLRVIFHDGRVKTIEQEKP